MSGVSFANNLAAGFEDTAKVQGQGANVNPQVVGYDFINMGSELDDAGLWRAGSGDEASRVALKSVDGYTYAIPMFKVRRRSQIAYSDTGASPAVAEDNQNGNATNLAFGVSDRPDGKFHDGIDVSDISDNRKRISLGNIDFRKILDRNLDRLLRGTLHSGQAPKIQYDSISDSDVNGYTDFLNNDGASGKRKIWSDAASDQNNIFAEVKTTTTDNSLDSYRSVGVGAWGINDKIIIQTVPELPAGTLVKATPRIYVENLDRLNITGTHGTFSGLNSSTVTWTFSSVAGLGSLDIWVEYDLSLPDDQGVSFTADDMLRIDYQNFNAFPTTTGIVVRGERLEPNVTRFQDLHDHPHRNVNNSGVFDETVSSPERKEVEIRPLIQTTTVRDGGTRSMEVQTLDASAKRIFVPQKLQHVKGVYTSATGGTELATQAIANVNPSLVDTDVDFIRLNNNYIAELTSILYDPTGFFSGGEIELLIASAGVYGPVYEHRDVTAETPGTSIRLYDANGDIFDIPPGAITGHFRISGRQIAVRSGSGYGWDINDVIIDCTSSDNNGLFGGFIDGQQLWVDCDFLGAPHNGAELRIAYSYSPYQGSEVGGQTLELIHKREKAIFFNNGTGGNNVSTIDGTGTSNVNYTPMSPRLPGSFADHLRDGSLIELSSIGIKRYDTDALFSATYDLTGYFGGGVLDAPAFVMPLTPETTSRGFLGAPLSEVIFELPALNQSGAEFMLPLLVQDRATKEVFLFIQLGNSGVHKTEEGPMSIDIFRLGEPLIIK